MNCTYPNCTSIKPERNGICATHNRELRKPVKEAKVMNAPANFGGKKKQKAIARSSETNTWEDSFGNRYTSAEVDRNIHASKARKLAKFMHIHGYYFCEDCKRHHDEDGSPLVLDCSHTISVAECKAKGMVEFAWDEENNIKIRCQVKCHRKHDKSGLQWTVNQNK